MPDVFISYKKEEREVAATLATCLTESGYQVWWDAALLAGSRFEDEITAVLTASTVVIVLWSARAVGSEWVKAEAEAARSQKKALPALIDDTPPDELPLLYRGLHCADLRHWTGDPAHAGYAELLRAVAARCGAAGPPLSTSEAKARLAESAGEAEAWAAIAGKRAPSAADYEGYLRRFGEGGRFAATARLRVRESGQHFRVPRWWLVAAPFAAAIVIAAGLGGWYLYGRSPADLVPQGAKDAAARCVSWSLNGAIDWDTNLPLLQTGTLDNCKSAAKAFPKNGDYPAYEAMALSLEATNHNTDIEALIDSSVALGSPIGMYMQGVTRPDSAEKYFKAAADAGYARAAGRLCLLAQDLGGHLSSDGGDPNAFKAYCKSAAEAGDPFGQVGLGYLFEYGKANESIDENKAKAQYKAAADQGFALGKVMLGALLVRGRDVLHDFEKAFSLFNEAAEAGQPEGYRWRAIAYEESIGTKADIAKASRDYDTASFRYDEVAAMLVGDLPQGGYLHTGLADDEIARQLLNGDSIGQRMRGAVLWLGYHQDRDYKGAEAALLACASLNALCQMQLGRFYAQGPQSFRDAPKGRQYLELGAEQGEMRSEFWLAEMLRRGEGGPADPDRARTLYQQAAAQGFYMAQDYLNQQNKTVAPAN